MTYVVRSIDAISKTIRGAVRRILPGTDALPAPNTIGVFAKVFAAACHDMDLRGAWVYRQIFASTADVDHLDRHGYEIGIARKAASASSGSIAATATAGQTIPSGLTWLSGGVEFVSTAAATADGSGAIAIPVRSRARGADSNREPGEILTFADAALAPSLSSTATVGDGGLSGGSDRESDASYRARILDRKRRPPQGGAESDYEAWALAAGGVSAAWARRLENASGAVGVWILGEGGEIPASSLVDAVKADLEARRLIGLRDLRVYAPTAVPINVTLSVSPNTIEVRTAAELAIAKAIADRRRPGLPNDDFIFSRSWLVEAVATAVGEDSHTITLPSGNIEFGLGEIPVTGAITFS